MNSRLLLEQLSIVVAFFKAEIVEISSTILIHTLMVLIRLKEVKFSLTESLSHRKNGSFSS